MDISNKFKDIHYKNVVYNINTFNYTTALKGALAFTMVMSTLTMFASIDMAADYLVFEEYS